MMHMSHKYNFQEKLVFVAWLSSEVDFSSYKETGL